MGSLDDAIREHLELKRQHGASDDEVKRQEDEAFGKARRAASEPQAAPAEDPLDDPIAPDDPLAPDELEAAEPRANGQPADHSDVAPVFDPEPFEPDEVPSDESLEAEMTVRDAREDVAPSSDPLEETPEFLQESEEDRLWFEQRPPKDFDFD